MSDYPPPPPGGTDPSETVWSAPPPPGGEPPPQPGYTPPPTPAPGYTPPPAPPQPGYAPPQPGYAPPQPGYAPPQPGYAPPQPGYAQPAYAAVPAVGPDGRPLKSKMAGGLLGIFLGGFGAHRFYLGYTGLGITMVLLSVLSCFMLYPIIAVWGLVEGILILTGSPSFSRDSEGRPLEQ